MDRKSLHILVIDDVQSMREQVKSLLIASGYSLIVTADGGASAKTALENGIVEGKQIDLIVCDWHMEPLDGMAVLKMVREHPIHYETPFIMVTAEDTKERVIEAITQGVNDYIIKPLTPEKVSSRIDGLLRKRKLIE